MFFAIFDDFYGGLDRPSPTRAEKPRRICLSHKGKNKGKNTS